MEKSLHKTIIIFLFLFSFSAYSQTPDSTYVNNKLIDIYNLNSDGKFNKAYETNNILLSKLLKSSSKSIYLAHTYFLKSKIEINLGKYKESILSAHKAVNLFTSENDTLNIASSLNLLGVNFYFLSDYDSTKIYYEKSLELKKKLNADNTSMAISSYNLAMAYEDLDQTDKALKLYKQAESYLLKDKKSSSFLSDIYNGISLIYFYKKDIDKAEKYAEKALDVGLKVYGEFNPNITFTYTSYANILEFKKKYKESIQLLKKSLKIRETTYGKNHKWTCESYYDLANAYVLDKQFTEAEKHYRKAIKIGEKSNSLQYLANAKTALAKMYISQKTNKEKVNELLKSALQNKLSVFGIKSEMVAENYLYLAKNALLYNDEKSFNKYINLTLKSGNYQRKNLFNLVAPFKVLDALVLQGDWFQKRYEDTKNDTYLEKKYILLNEELNLIQYLQKGFTSDKSKIYLANNYRKVFEKGLNTCWELYKKTKNKKYLERAFELTETNRNTILLEGLQDSKFKLYGNIPEELLQQEKQIKKELTKINKDFYYENSSSVPDKLLLSKLLDKRIVISSRLDSLQSSFALNYPKYKSLKFQNKTITTKDVQKEIGKNQQIITYFLGDKKMYTIILTKNNIKFEKDDKPETIVGEIRKLKEAIVNQNSVDNPSIKLYQLLLKNKIDSSKKELVIIPDNILNYIPFEILKDNKKQYLIENYIVSYSGSNRLLLELKNDYFNYKLPKYWVGFSPVYTNEDLELSSTSTEIEDISKIIDGESFIGKDSNKKNFFSNNTNHSIIHLAMHAEIDNKNPMYNKLIFSDGDLTSSEIYIANNKANLAVLSACNTGFGKLEKGEGVMSMARAFHFSGIPSIVMSLWKVPDKETKILMVNFYKYLKEGMPKNKALRRAKLDYLQNTNVLALSHPYYWSGFVLTGNTRALNNNYTYYLLGSILIGLLVLIFISRKKLF